MKKTGLLQKEYEKLLWMLLPAVLVIVWSLGSGSAAAPLPFVSPLPTPGWSEEHTTPTPRPQPTVVATTGPATLSTGLKGYWKLDEADSGLRFDSGNTALNTLTNVNGVGWQTGRIGNASDFERNANQYVKRENYEAVGLNFSHSFTLVGWVRRESVGQTMALAGKYGAGTGFNERAYLLYINSNNKLQFNVSPDGIYNVANVVTGGSRLDATSSWYHVAGVFDASAGKMRLYLNGGLDAEKTVTYHTVFQSDAPFMLGASAVSGNGATNYFDGLLDEWRVYNRALSQSEIQTLMNLQ